LGAHCGINLPYLAYLDSCGLEIQEGADYCVTDYRTDVRWLSFGRDLIGFVREYRSSGVLTLRSWLRSLGGAKVFHYFSWDDPLPFAVSTGRYVRRIIEAPAKKIARVVRGT
jgi:hypothetical protein